MNGAEGKAILQLDIKRGTSYDAVARTIDTAGMKDGVILIAYNLGQARALQRAIPGAMLSVSVENQSDLQDLLASGLDSQNILAFLGTSVPDPSLVQALNDREIETIIGTLGGRQSIDQRADQLDSNDPYYDLTDMGVAVIATDRPVAVANAYRSDDKVLSNCSPQLEQNK